MVEVLSNDIFQSYRNFKKISRKISSVYIMFIFLVVIIIFFMLISHTNTTYVEYVWNFIYEILISD